MLAMYTNVQRDNWAGLLLPFVQLPHSTAYSETLEETHHFLVFGRRATLPIYVIVGVPCKTGSDLCLDYSPRTVYNLQVAYELARRNHKKRSDE